VNIEYCLDEHVLTPKDSDIRTIFGVVYADTVQEAGAIVLQAATEDPRLDREVFFNDALQDMPADGFDLEPGFDLLGAGWFELAPTWPMPGGDPGGMSQCGDALSRRFVLKRADGSWAVLTRYVFLSMPSASSDEMQIETLDEFLICTNLHDVQGTSTFEQEVYNVIAGPPNFEDFLRKAESWQINDITWDGEPFHDLARTPSLR
jgi:hypothetical protein